MIEQAIDRIAVVGVWTAPVLEFLKKPATVAWLTEVQREAAKSDDEIILVLTCALRFLDLTLLDGGTGPDELARFLGSHDAELRTLCRTRRVQANVAERALPVLELLARWSPRKLFVTELGCSFGLIGRALVSAPRVLEGFDSYFAASQQRPDGVPLIAGYRGLDLSPPEQRWLLACIPFPELRSRISRFIDEVPAGPDCVVTAGSAFDLPALGAPPTGTVPVVLTSFMLYQLPDGLRADLKTVITDYIRAHQGSWVNLDVQVRNGSLRFVVEQDGVEKLELTDDLGSSWTWL